MYSGVNLNSCIKKFTGLFSYEKLVRTYPEANEYRAMYAQSLYKAGNYQEAQRATLGLAEDPQYAQRVLKIQAYSNYEQDDAPGTKSFLDQCSPDDPDAIITQASLLFKV
jgi:tetratricopeptide repeat protein 30